MRMDMPGVQMRADNIFIPPAQHTVCKFLCNPVRQFRRNLVCRKALHKVVSLHAAGLVPAFFCMPHIRKRRFQCAGKGGFIAGLLGFTAVGGIANRIFQRYRRGFSLFITYFTDWSRRRTGITDV